MRVFQFEGDFNLTSLREVRRPDPTPGPGDIVLRMRAASLNYRDLAIMRGDYHVPVSPPLVPLSDGAGEVVEVGPEVHRFRVGDLACPTYLPDWLDGPIHPRHLRRRLGGPDDGVLAELICVPEGEAVRVPEHLDPTEASTLPVAAVTAWHSLFELDRPRPGETMLVQGSGGVSTMAIQLLTSAGVRVIAVTRGDRHAERLRALGAERVVIDDGTRRWPEQVLAETGGGVDGALNVAGGGTLTPMVSATRMGGRVHAVGYAADRAAELDIFTAIQRATTIRVATGGSRADFEALASVIRTHRIRPAVDRVFPLTRLADAVGHLRAGGHFGKIVIAPIF